MTLEQLINEQIKSFTKKQIEALAILNELPQGRAIGNCFNHSIMRFLRDRNFIALRFVEGYWRNVNNFHSSENYILRCEMQMRGLI